jgi:hypothetical protein
LIYTIHQIVQENPSKKKAKNDGQEVKMGMEMEWFAPSSCSVNSEKQPEKSLSDQHQYKTAYLAEQNDYERNFEP